jgi:Pectate lyase superfamily protein
LSCRRFCVSAFVLVSSFLLTSPDSLAQTTPVCNVRNYGAKGDGTTFDSAAVSAAIAACVKQGGGTVYFPAGRYVIGTVQLYSHIRLFLDNGAALVGSRNVADYLASAPFGFGHTYGVDITGEGTVLGMLIAKNADDVSIEGGEIDGNGDSFMELQTSHGGGGSDYMQENVRDPVKFRAVMNSVEEGPVEPVRRPGTMIVFFHCTNVRMHGIVLRNAPNWTMSLQDVDTSTLSNFEILNNPRVPNNDGIDCMMCRHVRISDCDIETGDDGLAIVGSEHMNVSNCSLSSRSAAIRLESTKLSTFTGLSMDTNRGIAVFANTYANSADKATENVTFSDIVIRTRLFAGSWWGKAEPIYIAVQACAEGKPCGIRVRNVVFNNITAEAENGALLWGGVGSPITGVEVNGLRLHMISPKPSLSESLGGNLDLRWTAVTPRYGITKSDIPAFYAKQVAGLTLKDVTVDWEGSLPGYFSDGIRVEDFTDLTIDGYSGRQAHPSSGSAIFLKDGFGVSITNSRAMPITRAFVHLDHVTDRRVFVNYDVKSAIKVIEPAGLHFDTEVGFSGSRDRR